MCLALRPRLAPVTVAIAALLAINTTTARPLWIDAAVERRVGGPQRVGTENTLFGAGTTTGGEFVPRSVDLTGFAERPYGNGMYERLYPEFGWLGGKVRALEGPAQVLSFSSASTWTDARVRSESAALLAFRTVAFPGWRAYVDGREVVPGTAPRDPQTGISPGFITVPVPAVEHRVQIAFGPTRLRTAAGALSIAAFAGAIWWLRPARRVSRALAIAAVLVLAL